MTQLSVSTLPPDKVREAYPLIRAAAHIRPERWAAYVRLTRRRGGDVLVVTDEDGRIYGTAAFRTGSTLRHPHSLIVDAIAAFEISQFSLVKQHLCEALHREALARGCTTILVQSSAPKSALSEQRSSQWKALGLSPETMTIVQEISLAPVPQNDSDAMH